jgi:hypothetical protein
MVKAEVKLQPTNTLSLEQLHVFEKINVTLGAELGEQLAQHPAPIICFIKEEEQEAAHVYREIIRKPSSEFMVSVSHDPLTDVDQVHEHNVIPIVIHSATDPTLKDLQFGRAGFGELLADSFPVPSLETDATPILQCVGISRQGIHMLTQQNNPSHQNAEERRSHILKHMMADIITPFEFQTILQSRRVEEVHIHALGPEGTNISQASRLYAKRLGIENKTNITVYPAGITPLTYAQLATEATEASLQHARVPSVVHLHVECAVYNNMGRLYKEKQTESVFIDTQNMPLDTMQLASKQTVDELQNVAQVHSHIRIATHPSPRPLINPWIDTGKAVWLEASSNSAAALMVLEGLADACVTTESTIQRLTNTGIQTLHKFGSPNMIFTVASPLSPTQLHEYLKEGV